MTEQEFERHADEMWVQWRKQKALKLQTDPTGELEIWHAAYVMGVALGVQLTKQGEPLPESWDTK